MTTAARPTFNPARGGSQKGESDLGKLSKQYSSRDLPGHTKLKYREPGQNAPSDVRSRNLRRDLEERERVAYKDRGDKRQTDRRDYKRQRIEQNLDADDPVDSSSDSDDSSDSEDDTADLLAELNRIKKERAEEAAKKELEKQDEEARIRTENILKGNPLLQLAGNSEDSFAVKRRWDDDVVFKNCARGEPDKTKKQFINDTLRSEFHRKFMDKYVK